MAKVSTYLNFDRKTEEAFNFYKSVFGGEFVGGISRMGEVPPQEGMPPLADADKNLVMHVELPILGGVHSLMGTDATESMGQKCIPGTNMYINLGLDSRDDLDRIFKALSAGGKVEMAPMDMFWGDYFASFTDAYGINWMLNTPTGK